CFAQIVPRQVDRVAGDQRPARTRPRIECAAARAGRGRVPRSRCEGECPCVASKRSDSAEGKMIHQLIDLWLRGWRSLVEILLLWVAIYYGYLYFRGTRGAKVLTGLAIVFLTLTLISTLL